MKETVYYVDTSALIKRYIEESGSEKVEHLWPTDSKKIFTASLTYAEMYAGFYRLNRNGRISGKHLARSCEEFESDWRTLVVIEFASEVQKNVSKIISKVSLRGADLVHMASVVYLLERNLNCELLTYDERMVQASEDLGVRCPLS